MSEHGLILANVVVSFGLMVLIWIIQILHYPVFAYFDENSFTEVMSFHQTRITMIVMPLMVSELLIAIFLCLQTHQLFYLQLAIVILLWIITMAQFMPLHQKLLAGKNLKLIKRLVNLNWIRTILWTLKGALASYFILRT